MKSNPIVSLSMLLGGMALAVVAAGRGCACSPSEECSLYRALCQLDVCIAIEPEAWYACQAVIASCDVDTCVSRSQCTEAFFTRCRARMVPGARGYEAYQRCAALSCSERPPDAPSARPDASRAADGPTSSSADGSAPASGPICAGVMCAGECCTAYPCFDGKRCTCQPSAASCTSGGDGAPITPSCCSDAPLCSAQGKHCCFVAASGGGAAQTRCLTICNSEARHCTYAPFLQGDGATSCLPPPYDREGVLCPF